jgi:hypothetical protein
MQTEAIQQEVLLMSGTSFLLRLLAQDGDAGQQQGINGYNRLEEACWNGLLQLMLPEVFDQPLGNKNLFMWKVTGLENFIEMELGNTPAEKDNEFSINPVIFLSSKLLS